MNHKAIRADTAHTGVAPAHPRTPPVTPASSASPLAREQTSTTGTPDDEGGDDDSPAKRLRATDEPAGLTAGNDTKPESAWRTLRSRNIRLYLGAMFLSQIGIWVQTVAVNWVVYDRTGSAANVGYLTAAALVPTLLLGLHGGVWADRLVKLRGLLGTQIFLAAQGACVAALFLTAHMPPLWTLMLLMAAKGVATAIDGPLRQSFIAELVPATQIPQAVSLNATIFNSSMLIGAVIGGFLVDTIGIVWCLLLDAATYLIVVIGLLAMRREELHASQVKPRRDVNQELREGLRFAFNNRDIRSILIALAIVCTTAMNTQVVLPGFAGDVFDGGNQTFTIFAGAVALGSLTGAVAASRARHSSRHLATSFAGLAAAWTATTLSPHPLLAVGGLAVCGYYTVYLMAQAATMLHQNTVPELRGRIMSIYLLLAIGSKPLGALLVAWTSLVDPRGGPALAAVGSALGACTLTRRRSRGRRDTGTTSDLADSQSVGHNNEHPDRPSLQDTKPDRV